MERCCISQWFLQGLSGNIKGNLVSLDFPEGLDSLIALAIKIDKRVVQWDQDRGRLLLHSSPHQGGRGASLDQPNHLCAPSAFPALPAVISQEPMQLGNTRLSCKEHLCQKRDGCCFFGTSGHGLPYQVFSSTDSKLQYG